MDNFDKKAHKRSLMVLSALMRALSHEIRTPLSVIQNDLHYYSSKGEDCNVPIRNCKKISDILHKAQDVGLNRKDTKERFNLSTALKESDILKSELLEECLKEHAYYVSGNPREIIQAIRYLIDLLGNDEHLQVVNKRTPIISKSGNRVSLGFEFSYSTNEFAWCLTDSITDFYCMRLNRDSVFPALIDSLLWNNRVEIELTASETLWINLSFEGRDDEYGIQQASSAPC